MLFTLSVIILLVIILPYPSLLFLLLHIPLTTHLGSHLFRYTSRTNKVRVGYVCLIRFPLFFFLFLSFSLCAFRRQFISYHQEINPGIKPVSEASGACGCLPRAPVEQGRARVVPCLTRNLMGKKKRKTKRKRGRYICAGLYSSLKTIFVFVVFENVILLLNL